jgi:hypothetical protein
LAGWASRSTELIMSIKIMPGRRIRLYRNSRPGFVIASFGF